MGGVYSKAMEDRETAIAEAASTGMIKILKGELGFRSKPFEEEEKKRVVLELLKIGMNGGYERFLADLETGYHSQDALDFGKRRHFQMSALYVLAAHRNWDRIDSSKWYLANISQPEEIKRKVFDYVETVSPSGIVGAGAGAGTGSVPGVIPIANDAQLEELEKFVKGLVEVAIANPDVKAWKENVAPLLADYARFRAVVKNEKIESIILAISRLLHYKQDPDSVVDYDEGIDQATLERAYRQYFPATPPRTSVEESIEYYLGSESTLNLFLQNDDIKAALQEALLEHIGKNGGAWPRPESLKKAEQFFWNLCRGSTLIHVQVGLIKTVFGTPIKGDWNDFIEFCRPYTIEGLEDRGNIVTYRNLLPVYQAFSTLGEREAFLEFCKPYLSSEPIKITVLAGLLPVYQAFSTRAQREAFLKFCEPYLSSGRRMKSTVLASLLPVYQAFSTPAQREAFLDFCKPYPSSMYDSAVLAELLPVYQAFSTLEEREAFLDFCKTYLHEYSNTPNQLKKLLPVYQAFSTPEKRAAFLRFCEPYIPESIDKNYFMLDILPLYQSFGIDESEEVNHQRKVAFDELFALSRGLGFREDVTDILIPIYLELKKSENIDDFKEFCKVCRVVMATYADINPIFQIYKSGKKNDFLAFMKGLRVRGTKALWSYVYRAYLQYVRVNAALGAEGLSLNESGHLVAGTVPPSRLQAMYEIGIKNQLPVYYGADPLLMEALAGQGAANAHDFDGVYKLDQGLFFEKSNDLGYEEAVDAGESDVPHPLYNNREIKEDYRTNNSVQDFIHYLDTTVKTGRPFKIDGSDLTGEKVVSTIKQMLGLEPKESDVTGGFAPYLGSSMYYAEPDSPTGDEMLGRVWFFMKKIAKDPTAESENKRAVVMAILEAAEFSGSGISTHCQTRMTGELMKLISWHLEGSKLRHLIAADDLPPVTSDDDIKERIASAPFRAQQLFNRMKGEDLVGVIRALIERKMIEGEDPELWERYQAYYDALYRRTRNEDGSFQKDENILTRNGHGDLVSLYDGDGNLRPEPIIVYYQAEFQVFEQAFTELMRKQFEEQRGLIY